jgi:hypothetical protein
MKNISFNFILIFLFVISCGNPGSQNSNGKSIQAIQESPSDSSKYQEEMLTKGFELEKNEKIGQLQFGLSYEKVIELIGEPETKPEYVVSDVDGATYKNIDYNKKGIFLSFEMKEDSTTELSSIEIKEPCNMMTTKNVGIGSTFEDVKKAYNGLINPEGSGQETLVVGTVYGGLVFNFKDSKVQRVYIGASAE